ncbi:hypothetical protein AB0F13_23105 [Streptomyces sp. NPDC026206]|uniref:hypothetical protein n=1 Tax=Streptomyces sp. NPDC026206 TaxID=3157089 RepID=UPI0033EDA998
MRKAVQITGAAIIAAVLMTGCSKSSDDEGKKTGATPSADAGKQTPGDASKGQTPGGTPGKNNVSAADLAGGWSNGGKLTDKSLVILSFAQSTVMLSGKTACSGTLVDNAQPVTINIKRCQDGSTDYTTGTVKNFDGKSFTVAWASGKEDKFSKAVGADGKPAAGLPGGIPAKPGS